MAVLEPHNVFRPRISEMEAQTGSKLAPESTAEQPDEKQKPEPSLLSRTWRGFVFCVTYKHPYPLLGLLTLLPIVTVSCSIAQILLLALIFNDHNSGHKLGYWYLLFLSSLNIATNIITRPRQWSKPFTWYQEEYRLWSLTRSVIISMNCVQTFASSSLGKISLKQDLVSSLVL